MVSLDVVIVNWNTARELTECLTSIATSSREAFHLARVVVVDNASRDGSCSQLEAVPLPLMVVRNTENRGFAAACNQGAAGSKADYLLFLNPDTRLFPETLTRAVTFMERSDSGDIGICGIRLVDAQGDSVVAGAHFPTVRSYIGQASGLDRLLPASFPPLLISMADNDTTRDVDQVIGAFFMVRRHVFESIGGFDEQFFVYFEEVDFSLRTRQRGFRSVCFAGATAVHHGTRATEQVKATRLFYSLRSRVLYAFKHFSPAGAWVTVAVTLGPELIARTLRALGHRSAVELREVANGYANLVRDPALWRRGGGSARA